MKLNEKGFTLIEMLVVWGSLSVLILASTTFLFSLWSGTQLSITKNNSHTEAEFALNRITRELRQATQSESASPPNVTIPSAPNNTQLTFYVPADLNNDGNIVDSSGNIQWDILNPITYEFDAANGQIRRVSGADVRIIANEVTQLTFENSLINPNLSANEIGIQLTVQMTTSQGFTIPAEAAGVIKLRN